MCVTHLTYDPDSEIYLTDHYRFFLLANKMSEWNEWLTINDCKASGFKAVAKNIGHKGKAEA